MTSKISFFKLLKEDLKRRSWLVALSSLLYFILIPVLLLMQVEGQMENVRTGYMDFAIAQDYYREFMGAGNTLIWVLLAVTAIIAAYTGFSFLHSRVKLDLYHSLPIRRKKYFLIQYLSGIIIFLIPYLISILLCWIIGGINGLLTGAVFAVSLKMLLLRMLEYITVYAVAILAMVMTGKIITAILGTLVFAAYIPAVMALFVTLAATFFNTYMGGGAFSKFGIYFSPMVIGGYVEEMFGSYNLTGKWAWLGVGIMLLWALALTGISIWLYSIRKTESAEISMAFPKTESFIKVFLVIPMALATGVYVSRMLSRNSTIWFFIGILFAVIILSGIIEFIYHMNMKELFSHKLPTLIAGVFTVVIALGFQYDWIGYDTYLPDKEDVKQMSIYNGDVNGSFVYKLYDNGTGISYSATDALEPTLTSNFDPIYALASEAAVNGGVSDAEEKAYFSVAYVLSSGKKVFRSYAMDREKVDQLYEKLYQDPEFVGKLYPILSRTPDEIRAIYLTNLMDTTQLELTKEQRTEFMEAYKADLKNAGYKDIMENTSAMLSFDISEENNYNYLSSDGNYPICPDFTNTLTYLEKTLGITLETKLKAEDVSKITITDYRKEDAEGEQVEFTEKKDIEEILQYLKFNINGKVRFSIESMDIYIELTGDKNMIASSHFAEGQVAPCVEAALSK